MSSPGDDAYEAAKADWIARQLAKAPALTEWQKQVIRTNLRPEPQRGAA
ncbi:hypothetical protein ACPESR_25500 [Nocardia testacea]|jgi:SRSO17 transposase